MIPRVYVNIEFVLLQMSFYTIVDRLPKRKCQYHLHKASLNSKRICFPESDAKQFNFITIATLFTSCLFAFIKYIVVGGYLFYINSSLQIHIAYWIF